MKDIIPAKKQSPILGLTGMGGGVGSNIVAGGAAEEAKYIDEVFNNYLWDGVSDAAQNIESGLDMTKGGMVWNKRRDAGGSHVVIDSERGANYALYPDTNNTNQYITSGSAFTNTGFTFASENNIHPSNSELVTWSFRKQKGFFDVVQWTGNGVDGRQISHDLGCVPGFVAIKCTSDTENWACYHRDWTGKVFEFDTTSVGTSGIWKNTLATDTYISVNAQAKVNGTGKTYVGYFFAGGASTAATARSVVFDGSGDYLVTNTSGDYDFGSGDFTIEHWIKPDNFTTAQIVDARPNNQTSNNFCTYITSDQTYRFNFAGDRITSMDRLVRGAWSHIALVRSSGVTTLYVNGKSQGTYNDSNDYGTSQRLTFGIHGPNHSSYPFEGELSNIRVAKGTAIYTESFIPPTTPLTTTSQGATNVKLLCANNASVTGTTIGTLTDGGNPTASTNSPFDDPEGFKFGENEDQNLIKCGSYVGHNDSDKWPDINVGWEPQWVMIKRTDSADNWVIWDSMRGLLTGGNDNALYVDLSNSEGISPYLSLTSTGFKFNRQSGMVNNQDSTYFYVVIRRPDGYVGKPAEAGTDVFTMDTGNGSTTGPAFDSNFAVDMAIKRNPTSTHDWGTHFRLTGPKDLRTNTSDVEGNDTAGGVFDYPNGVSKGSHLGSQYQAWMWKRHAGLDVVTYNANNTQGHSIAHNLGRVPEMIWFKNRDNAWHWNVYHIGLNGGTDPQKRHMRLDTDNAEVNLTDHGLTTDDFMNDKMPTATHFELGDGANPNLQTGKNIAILFASVDGISKVGYYAGTGSNLTITTGFQPRFVIIRSTSGSRNWLVFDTTRGWAAGNDQELNINKSDAQGGNNDFGAPTATGFTANAVNSDINASGHNYIYYAHA